MKAGTPGAGPSAKPLEGAFPSRWSVAGIPAGTAAAGGEDPREARAVAPATPHAHGALPVGPSAVPAAGRMGWWPPCGCHRQQRGHRVSTRVTFPRNGTARGPCVGLEEAPRDRALGGNAPAQAAGAVPTCAQRAGAVPSLGTASAPPGTSLGGRRPGDPRSWGRSHTSDCWRCHRAAHGPRPHVPWGWDKAAHGHHRRAVPSAPARGGALGSLPEPPCLSHSRPGTWRAGACGVCHACPGTWRAGGVGGSVTRVPGAWDKGERLLYTV